MIKYQLRCQFLNLYVFLPIMKCCDHIINVTCNEELENCSGNKDDYELSCKICSKKIGICHIGYHIINDFLENVYRFCESPDCSTDFKKSSRLEKTAVATQECCIVQINIFARLQKNAQKQDQNLHK